MLFSKLIYADHWYGENYAKNSSVQVSHAQQLLINLNLKGDENILDLGCGDGKITALLSGKVPQGKVVGLDPSSSMLQTAQEIIRSNNCYNVSLANASAENFLLEEKFDHVIAIHVMHWVKEQKKALLNIYNHLKANGQVHFIIAPSKEGLPFHKALKETLQRWEDDFKDFVNPQQVFNIEEYRKLMIDAGFHIDNIYYVYHESLHVNKDRLKEWIRQWLPYGKYLPDSKKDIFLNELMNHYLRQINFESSEKPITWGEYVLFINARKK